MDINPYAGYPNSLRYRSDLIRIFRDIRSGRKFEITPRLSALLGCSGEDFYNYIGGRMRPRMTPDDIAVNWTIMHINDQPDILYLTGSPKEYYYYRNFLPMFKQFPQESPPPQITPLPPQPLNIDLKPVRIKQIQEAPEAVPKILEQLELRVELTTPKISEQLEPGEIVVSPEPKRRKTAPQKRRQNQKTKNHPTDDKRPGKKSRTNGNSMDLRASLEELINVDAYDVINPILRPPILRSASKIIIVEDDEQIPQTTIPVAYHPLLRPAKFVAIKILPPKKRKIAVEK